MTLWGGRFTAGPDEVLWRYTVDHADRRLLVDDIDGSIAHATMLAGTGILSEDEGSALLESLASIRAEAVAGEFVWEDSDEDVHSAVERRLTELAGDVAGKLHTGRSRNDQIALDVRLYLRREAAGRQDDLDEFIGVLLSKAEEAGETIVPSYTHLQQAQAVPLAHHLLAYAWMLLRDRDRFAGVAQRLSEDRRPLSTSGKGRT